MISIHTPLAGSDAAFRMRLASSTVFQSTLPLRGATKRVWASNNLEIFQSTLPLRGATFAALAAFRQNQFQSTLPLRGATWSVPCRPSSWCNFNPHSPCGERQKIPHRPLRLHYFNPHSPCGERPTGWGAYRIRHEFQSTLPLRGATVQLLVEAIAVRISIHTPLAGSDRARTDRWSRQRISIHTPLAGSDFGFDSRAQCRWYFNPHSPCGERRAVYRQTAPKPTEFQSTLPLRGATNARSREIAAILISIHTPLAGSDVRRGPVEPARQGISIHTPLAGSDLQIKGLSAGPLTFQSTLPLRGATCLSVRSCRSRLISIHTPLAGSDKNSGSHDVAFQLISIHTPLAGSDLAWRAENHRRNISIHTPLAGSDQLRLALHSLWGRISIHTPLAGSDVMLENAFQTPSDFNPHSPCGERPQK